MTPHHGPADDAHRMLQLEQRQSHMEVRMSKTTIRNILLGATLVVVAGSMSMRADTFIYTDTSLSIGDSWSSGGGDMYINTDGFGAYWLQWTGTWWDSFYDFSGSGLCCGYGTHVGMTNPGGSSSFVYFTNDGNLLFLDYTAYPSPVLWQTYTGGNYGGYLDLQNDHNIVVRSSGNAALWSIF